MYYTYDAQNQLIRVSEGDFRYEYTYDTYGNIRSVKRYENETDDLLSSNSYAYEDPQWIDRLTAFNNVQFTYDNIGNPLSYYNGSSYTFTWNGRELAKAVKGGVTTTYKYGADGLRTEKKVGSTTYNYYYNSKGQLIRQTWGTNYMDFLYDETGSAYSFIYNGTQYYYVKNLQGDVVKILNTSGTVVATYTYDAWGKVTNSGNVVGQYNPIRYRGYYYDTDTGFYYLQSRYYDPAIKRFINADGVISGVGGELLGYNQYTYCFNDPVNLSDPSGSWPKWIEDAANWVKDNWIQPIVDFGSDIVNYNPNNQSEETVLESNYFSNYKGTFVLRTDFERSGSFGTIFLTRETNDRRNPEDVLRHEYGHTQQLEQLGPIKYTLAIFIPSAISGIFLSGDPYFDCPWEVSADVYGQVQSRSHSQIELDRGESYLDFWNKIKFAKKEG